MQGVLRSAACVLLFTALTAQGANAARASGADLFMSHCAACHGVDGEGGGPVATVLQGTVPNLRALTMRNGGTFPTAAVTAYIDGRELTAAHGDRQMPIWGAVFRGPEQGTANRTVRARIKALVTFIRELQYR